MCVCVCGVWGGEGVVWQKFVDVYLCTETSDVLIWKSVSRGKKSAVTYLVAC